MITELLSNPLVIAAGSALLTGLGNAAWTKRAKKKQEMNDIKERRDIMKEQDAAIAGLYTEILDLRETYSQKMQRLQSINEEKITVMREENDREMNDMISRVESYEKQINYFRNHCNCPEDASDTFD